MISSTGALLGGRPGHRPSVMRSSHAVLALGWGKRHPWMGPPSWMGRLSACTTWRTNSWWSSRPSVLVAHPGDRQKLLESACWLLACQVCKCEGKFGWSKPGVRQPADQTTFLLLWRTSSMSLRQRSSSQQAQHCPAALASFKVTSPAHSA